VSCTPAGLEDIYTLLSLVFSGEPKWIVLSRGILATWIIIIVSIFACYNMVLETLSQVALTPVNDLRGYYAPSDFTITQTPVWNVILVRRYQLSLFVVTDYPPPDQVD
jgi:hypothetical protein